MKEYKSFYSLDLGTTKFCVAKFCPTRAKQGLRSLEVISSPADGMRRGMLSDFQLAKKALTKLIEKAEDDFGSDINQVVVGIAGSHLMSEKKMVSLELTDSDVQQEDILQLKKKAWDEFKIETRELLHCIPLSYQIDDRSPCDNPIGFTGRFLKGEFLFIHSDHSYLRDVIRICNQVGLQVDRLYSEPYASSVVTFDDEILNRGVAIADIGGGTTDGMVFQNGKADRCFTINIGGKLMTNDLAVGLNTTYEEAEHKKKALRLFPNTKSDSSSHEHQILLSRIEELAQFFAKELVPYKGKLNAGLYLTGGGSKVQDLDVYLKHRLKIPVRIVPPMFVVEHDEFQCEQNGANEFSTVLGLMKLELMHRDETGSLSQETGFKKYISSFFQWIKEMA